MVVVSSKVVLVSISFIIIVVVNVVVAGVYIYIDVCEFIKVVERANEDT